MAKDAQKIVKKETEEILKKTGLKAEVSVEENDEALEVSIQGENLGALIGFHGETLESLQLILSLIVNKELNNSEWKRVLVDIGSWRQGRLEALQRIIDKAVEEIKATSTKKVLLPTMSASQRREIHILVAKDYPQFETVSEGEEPYRRISLITK